MAAEPVSPEVAPTMVTRSPAGGELVVEQAPDELEGHVLEGEVGPQEQLQQVEAVGAERRDRADDRGG
jgi:hypothetical protein